MSNRIDGSRPSETGLDTTGEVDEASTSAAGEKEGTAEAEESLWGDMVDGLATRAKEFTEETIEGTKGAIDETVDTVNEEIDEVQAEAEEFVDQAEHQLDEFKEDVIDGIETAEDAAKAADEVVGEMVDDMEVVKEGRKLVDKAKAEAENAVDYTESVAKDVVEIGEENFPEEAFKNVKKAGKDLQKSAELVSDGLSDIREGKGFEEGLRKVGEGLDVGVAGVEDGADAAWKVLGAAEETYDRLQAYQKHVACEVGAEILLNTAKLTDVALDQQTEIRDMAKSIIDGGLDVWDAPGEFARDALGGGVEGEAALLAWKALTLPATGAVRAMSVAIEFQEQFHEDLESQVTNNEDGIRSLVKNFSPLERAGRIREMQPGDSEKLSVGFNVEGYLEVGGGVKGARSIEISREPDIEGDQVFKVKMDRELAVRLGLGMGAKQVGGSVSAGLGLKGEIEYTIRDPRAAELLADWQEQGGDFEDLALMSECRFTGGELESVPDVTAKIAGLKGGGKFKAKTRLDLSKAGDPKHVTELTVQQGVGYGASFAPITVPREAGLANADQRVEWLLDRTGEPGAELLRHIDREKLETALRSHDGMAGVDIKFEAGVKGKVVTDVETGDMDATTFTVFGKLTVGNDDYDATLDLTVKNSNALSSVTGMSPSEVLDELRSGELTVGTLQQTLEAAGVGDAITLDSKLLKTAHSREKMDLVVSMEHDRVTKREVLTSQKWSVADGFGAHVKG